MRELPRDIEIEFTLLPTEHGGPSAPLHSGARPQFYYANMDWIAQLEFIDVHTVHPGETVRAYATFVHPDEIIRVAAVGAPLLLRHGQQVIAYGRVLRLIDLETSARHPGRLTSA